MSTKRERELTRITDEVYEDTEFAKAEAQLSGDFVRIAPKIDDSTELAAESELDRASDLLARGETAIAVFTRGERFDYDPETRVGQTGNWWNISIRRSFDKVIIYLRESDRTDDNTVYLADSSGMTDSEEYNRRVIHFSDIARAGITRRNWKEFCETGRQYYCYLPKK